MLTVLKAEEIFLWCRFFLWPILYKESDECKEHEKPISKDVDD